MKKERKYDIIFIIIVAGALTLIHETGNAQIIDNKFALIFFLIVYFVGKGIGKGVKEKEWKEKTEENDQSS